MLMLVEIYRLPERRVFLRRLEEGGLLLVGIILLDRFNDGARVYPLVDVQRDGRYLEGGMLRLARPLQHRVEVRIVGVSLRLGVAVGVGRYETDGRVVLARLASVVVLFDGLLLALSHASPSSKSLFEGRSIQASGTLWKPCETGRTGGGQGAVSWETKSGYRPR